MDGWRVKNVFKSSNGVSYEVISSYMYNNLKKHLKITECISFERYPSTKKFLLCDEDPKGEVEVEFNFVRLRISFYFWLIRSTIGLIFD